MSKLVIGIRTGYISGEISDQYDHVLVIPLLVLWAVS